MINLKTAGLKKIKWGIAGCGNYADKRFIPALRLIRKNSIVSVYSHDLNRAKTLSERHDIPFCFNDYRQFLNSDINAVCITSANSDHHYQVIEAARAGKHVFCEKPLAVNSLQAEEMVNACKENGVILAVGYLYRFHPLVKKAKELISAGKIGKLISINTNFNIDYPPDSNFRFNKEKSGGGALRDLGTHMIDILLYLGGEIESLCGVMDQVVYKSDVEDFAAAIVKFKNGGYGYFNVSFNCRPSFNRIEIIAHRGAIAIENLVGRRLSTPKISILLEGEAKKSFRKRGNKIAYMMRDVQNSILRSEKPLADGEDGLINMKIMEELEKYVSER